MRPTGAIADFFAGRLGISMQSTAQLGRCNREIGGRFPLVCGRFPLSSPNAVLTRMEADVQALLLRR